MHLQHCRAASPALTRPRPHDVAALQHAVRSFHISARRNDESSGSGSNTNPAPGNSLRARSQVAGQRIQSLYRITSANANTSTAGQYKQVGLAGGSFPSGQNASAPRRILEPRRSPSSSGGSGSSGPRLQTPRIQQRVTDRAGGSNNRFPAARPAGNNRFGPRGGAAGGGAKSGGFRNANRGSGPRSRQGRGRRGAGGTKKDDASDTGAVKLSDTVLRYLLSLKAARRAVKTHTPRDPSKEALFSQSALSASLGQPGGAPALLAQRLRALADRAEMEPVPLLAQARRLVRGQFVKFADERERAAVLDVVAAHQAAIAAKLSARKGEEIAPRPIEFEELDGEVRQRTTDAVVVGRYSVHARGAEPPAEGVAPGHQSVGANAEVARRMLDLNGSYVGGVRERFLGRLDAVLGVQGPAASQRQQKANA